MEDPCIQIIKLKDNYLNCSIKNVDVSIINSLRRIMISEVPSIAFEYIIVESNDSNMPDEMLSHRLGLIPISIPDQTINNLMLPVDCACEFECPICTVKFDCHVSCPIGGGESLIVASNHLIPDNNWNIQQFVAVEYKIEEKSYPVPILLLRAGEKLRFKAIAKLGTGKQHAKWSPVSIATFYQEDDNIIFLLESNGIFRSIDIFRKSISLLINKLKDVYIK